MHSFTYELRVNGYGAKWRNGATEPKSLLFCPKTVYLRSWRESFQGPSTGANSGDVAGETIVREVVEEFKDTRQFFGLVGEAYWVTVPREVYEQRKGECAEFDVPADGVLALTPATETPSSADTPSPRSP